MKSSNFYVLLKVHTSTKIIEEINENYNICLNMPPPEYLKGRPIVGGTNCHTQENQGSFRENINPYDWDFIRKLPSHVDYPWVLDSFDVVSLYTSISHDLGLEALSYWIDNKRNLILERFPKAFILEVTSFLLLNNNFQFDIYMFIQLVCTAMGTKFACLSVGYLEETILVPRLIPLHFM